VTWSSSSWADAIGTSDTATTAAIIDTIRRLIILTLHSGCPIGQCIGIGGSVTPIPLTGNPE
jgi:hypothetical protein